MLLFLLAFIFAGLSIFSSLIISSADEWLNGVIGRYPLGTGHEYVITRNLKTTGGGEKIEEGTFYTFYPHNQESIKNRQSTSVPDIVEGRIIGDETPVELEDYLDQVVYIQGEFIYGNPIILKESGYKIDWLVNRSEERRIVLRIDELEIVE